MQKRLLLVPVSLLVILVLLLGACTKATPLTTTTQPPIPTTVTMAKPAPTTSAAPVTTTPKPATTPVSTTATPTASINKNGGALKFIWTETSALMGYPVTNSGSGAFYSMFSVESLLTASDQPYIYSPNLATSWELAPDKKSYTFKLRKGVKFFDGTDFNATAVKWNIDNCIADKRAEVAAISSVEVIDDYTVKVNLKNWSSLVLQTFADWITGIISPTAFQKNGKEWCQLNPVGTGPFKISGYEPLQFTKFAKNTNYWDPKVPYLDSVEIYAVKDGMTKQAMLLKGDVDGARELDTVTGKNVLATGKYFLEKGAMGNFNINFNSVDPKSIWSNPQMRMALEYAIDKQTLSDSLGNGFTSPSYECILGVWEVPNNNPGTTPRKYDPVKAAQMIKDAGFGSGIKTTLEINQKFMNDFMVAIQSQLAKVGISLDLDVQSTSVWQEKSLIAPAPNVLRHGRGRGGPFNMPVYLESDMASNSIRFPGVKRPDGWDAMLQQLLLEPDGGKMLAIVNQMEKKAYGEAFIVPIYIESSINIWSNNLKSDRGSIMWWGGEDQPGSVKYTYWKK